MARNGFVLVSTLTVTFVIIVLVSIAVLSSFNNRENAASTLRTSQAQFAAEAGLDQAVHRVWHQVWDGFTGVRNTSVYRNRLGSVVGLNNGGNLTIPSTTLPNGSSFSVTVNRADNVANCVVQLSVTSTGTLPDQSTRRLNQVFCITGGTFAGLDFALLTNNANCIFCHASIQSMDALRGAPSQSNPWSKTKVGTLETLQIRSNSANTQVGGSIITRGQFRDRNGSLITNPASVSVKSYLNPGSSHITDTTLRNLVNTDCSVISNCTANQNFYSNYPNQSQVEASLNGIWPDGELPNQFPLPIPDSNGNRLIDDTEWNEAVQQSLLGNDRDNPPGTLSGCAISRNPAALTDWPGTGSASLASGDSGNYVMDCKSRSLEINGTVYVNGDLVIRGKISGNGKLVVRGNVYVLGDLTYDCSATQGSATCDYSRPETLPKFGLVAGGNILTGDYLTPKGGSLTNVNVIDPGSGTGSASFTMSEVTLFNRTELLKALADPDYRPRFYKLKGSTDPSNQTDVPLYFWNDPTKEHGDKYSEFTALIGPGATYPLVVRISSTSTRTFNSAAEVRDFLTSRGAAIYSLGPNNNWVSEQALKRMWISEVENTSRASPALRTDGLLYSANAIFTLARKDSRVQGQWDIRGSVVAADTGILVPGNGGIGLNIYHDSRLKDFFTIRDNDKPVLRRSGWKVVSQ